MDLLFFLMATAAGTAASLVCIQSAREAESGVGMIFHAVGALGWAVIVASALLRMFA